MQLNLDRAKSGMWSTMLPLFMIIVNEPDLAQNVVYSLFSEPDIGQIFALQAHHAGKTLTIQMQQYNEEMHIHTHNLSSETNISET